MSMGATTTSSRIIRASPKRVYKAFVEADELLAWLPPGEMTGRFHAFDARVGGGYVMSLFYPESETGHRGKTAEREDKVRVRFVELTPPSRIVEAVTFDSEDDAFAGEMTLTVTIEPVDGGSEVALRFDNLPPGLRPEDNELGAQQSLDQLARYLDRDSDSDGALAPPSRRL
jgi:uncharacterized protein YndB with AHSA1/START domain